MELVLSILALSSFWIGLFIGWHFKAIHRRLDQLRTSMAAKVEKPKVPEKGGTEVFDPYDFADKVKMEHDEELRRLNGQDTL